MHLVMSKQLACITGNDYARLMAVRGNVSPGCVLACALPRMTLNPGQAQRTVRLPNPFHFTLSSAGWVHEPFSAVSAGQYRRM